MRFRRSIIAALCVFGLGTAAVRAKNVPYLPSTNPLFADPSHILATVNHLIELINQYVTPQTMAPYTTPRNVLDNGGMQVQQGGTGTRTAGTTTIPSSAYSADRWGAN